MEPNAAAGFHSTVMQRAPEDERREFERERDGSYARSPIQPQGSLPPHPYSPNKEALRRPSFGNSYRPETPLQAGSPLGPPHAYDRGEYRPMSASVERPQSGYYDPTSDSSAVKANGSAAVAQTQGQFQNRHFDNPSVDARRYSASNGSYSQQAPIEAHQSPSITHSHPPRLGEEPRSPVMPLSARASTSRRSNGESDYLSLVVSPPPQHAQPTGYPERGHNDENAGLGHDMRSNSAAVPTQKKADPMSFSSILTEPEPAAVGAPAAAASPQQLPDPEHLEPAPKKSKRKVQHGRRSVMRGPNKSAKVVESDDDDTVMKDSERRASIQSTSTSGARTLKRQANGAPKKMAEAEKEIPKAAVPDIDLDELSDLDPALEAHFKYRYKANRLKHQITLDEDEEQRRKVRRTNFTNEFTSNLDRHAATGEQRYRDAHVDGALASVQEKEIQAEKERKKDMQRKRRREKTVATNQEQKQALLKKAQETEDDAERERLLKEAERADKKVQATLDVLARGDKGPEIRTVSPIEPNFQGGTMSTFAAEPEGFTSAKGKGKGRGGARLRKSKEQKQAEILSAEAAQAAIDAGEEPPAPVETGPKIRLKVKPQSAKDEKAAEKERAEQEKLLREMDAHRESQSPDFDQSSSAGNTPSKPYESKTYHSVYDQIWKDIARKEIPKVFKIVAESQANKQSNLKKTAILASKEAKRWQLRTNKGQKDLQARAKRQMREMMGFWKRNEREERDMRRQAEKQEIENAKKAEADREANRQKRKLNFLISQTELYSHFIGKKIKTDEVERSTDHPDVAPTAGADDQHKVVVPEGAPAGKVTNFEDLDFDAEDETALQQAAMANAQNAIQEAQNKARAFNNEPAMDDEGEMNFQNPSGMGDVDIEQPKMLTATLKEYQLKGLNWLANLYDQGINGILADEMGLGKTIQSISVMAYLAEKHGIWGPFLVVAPASTLHNWQQEITKFVPRLKCLPYWGTAADRKVLRKFWDRKHITYTEDAPFHVLITSYQLVVSDVAYFQKMKWQYMILDEAQAIKSSQSSRWKSLLGFHCRNRLLLTGTPIQNNMQELWALLHFIMPSLFDSHDEFSEWFSKDIESHAQSNTKLNEDQLKRLHMILKPFMLRRVKKHVQKELGDKIELDIFCDLTYRQRAYYSNLRNQISIMDLIEKATIGDEGDAGTLMNLVMQFRKVCNHPDLFERAETTSPLSFGFFAETGSFLREGSLVNVAYSTRNMIEYKLPKLIWRNGGRLDMPGSDNEKAGFKRKWIEEELQIWKPSHTKDSKAFGFGRLAGYSTSDLASVKNDIFFRAVKQSQQKSNLDKLSVIYDDKENSYEPTSSMLRIVDRHAKTRKPLVEITAEGHLAKLLNVASTIFAESGMPQMESCSRPSATAPPITVSCSSHGTATEISNTFFNIPIRRALYGPSKHDEAAFLNAKVPLSQFPPIKMLPNPSNERQKFTNITVPSMRRFVTDSGKLAKLDELLFKLKEGGHRVLLYFQMTRMIDLMEEYLTYRNYKYLRLDGSTKLEDRRDTVHDFQTRPEIFIFLLSTRAGGLGINLTSADTVIFYDSDWNPTIDSQAMDRAHRLGQTRQVTVYRMITRGTIEERIRKRAMQKEEVQRVVISGGGGAGVDFNTRSRESKTKDIAMWLADDDQAAEIERKEAELARLAALEPETTKKTKGGRKKGKKEQERSLEELYHEGEGHFDDGSAKPSGTNTPNESTAGAGPKKRAKKGEGSKAKKAKSARARLAMVDGGEMGGGSGGDVEMGGL